MKQPIENLTLIYINKKTTNFRRILNDFCLIIWCNCFIFVAFLTALLNDNLIILAICVIIVIWILASILSLKLTINIILNLIEDIKGKVDYIGYNSYYIQYRLPECNPYNSWIEYYLLRKKENNILISNIQSIKLSKHIASIINKNMTITFIMSGNIKKIKLTINRKELNHFAEQFEQFAHSRHIEIQTFRV
ncbi:MAG: hypothetical protein IKZ88_04460 [Neisseriaceae bacterium]|nr:hypothetical protein [Neisseriaceae bacterium]